MFFFMQRHAFHLVDPSVMPLLSSLSCLVTALGAVLYFHGYVAGFQIQMFENTRLGFKFLLQGRYPTS